MREIITAPSPSIQVLENNDWNEGHGLRMSSALFLTIVKHCSHTVFAIFSSIKSILDSAIYLMVYSRLPQYTSSDSETIGFFPAMQKVISAIWTTTPMIVTPYNSTKARVAERRGKSEAGSR